MNIPIANGFYESESLPISAQQCVNLYPNIPQAPSLSDGTLLGTPGIRQIAATGEFNHVNRGAHVKGNIPYFVNGNILYNLIRSIDAEGNESFSVNSLGTIAGQGRVSMADNGIQLMILSPGGKGYIYDETSGTPFQEITDPDFTANGNPQHVVFIDGYFACTTDSKKWIISSINNGLSWNALDRGTAESDPDIIVAPIVFKNQIFITGSETTESFQNQPNGSGFPFIRSNLFLEKGCFAPFSLMPANNTFMMIGGGVNESPAVWQFTGGGFQKVSTTAIDNILSMLSDLDISEAFAWSYAERGAYFVGFTAGIYTFVYDVVSRRWHQRMSITGGAENRWRVNSIVKAYGRILVADAQDGRIGELLKDTYTEYGEIIPAWFTTQPLSNQGKGIRIPMIELTVESGVGNSDRPDPQVSMDISDDAKTFMYERQRPLGKAGEYDHRAIWYRNGRAPRFRIFRFKISDPVKRVIIKLEMSIA